jgi:hypothetical protein
VLCSFHDPLSYEDKAESDIKNFMIEDGKQTDMEIPEGLLSEEWDAIQIRLQKARYYPTWSRAAQGYVAANPEHQWGITYDEGAVLVNPSSGEDWSWLLTPTDYGYRGKVIPMNKDPEVTSHENIIEYVYNKDFTGWYVNNEKGLEHGFTLSSPPQPRVNEKVLVEMSLETSLTPKVLNEGENIVFLDSSGSEVLNYGKLLVTDTTGRNIPSELHMSSNSITISVDDIDAVYPLTIDPILVTEIAKITASDGEEDNGFGRSVSISGDTIVVGAHLNDIGGTIDQGSVYIFERNQSGIDNWGEVLRLIASDGAENDWFGYSVSISGDTVVIGVPGREGTLQVDQGSAYIFERNRGGSNNWGEVKEIVASDGLAGDYFGWAVSIDGDILVVGVPNDVVGGQYYHGSAYVFGRNQGGPDNWGEVKKLFAYDGLEGDNFGYSITISDDTVAVGAVADDVGVNLDQGSAYIFQRDEGGNDNWGVVTKITASDGELVDYFGISVSLSNDTLVVGSFGDSVGANTSQGSAYVFQRNFGGADNWGEIAWLSAQDGETNDFFGMSVSIIGDTAVIGVVYDDIDENVDQGSAYVYNRNQGDENNWGLVDIITASDGASNDMFGVSVSISGDTFIIGASGDNVSGNNAQGSAYLYRLGFPNNIPTITTADITTAFEDSQYFVDYEADDLDGDAFTWDLWTDANGWLIIDENTGVLSGTPQNSDVGSWTVNVSVSDSKGGTDFSNFTLTVENTNDAPHITTSNVNSANADELYSVDYEATDDDLSDTLSWDLDTNASWLYIDISSGVLSGIPDESDVGSYFVNVSVSDDNGGSDFTDFTLSVLNPNNVPVIITDNINSVLEGELYSVDYEATDDDQDILSWILNTNASWLDIDSSSGVLSGTPDGNDVGSYWIEVTVSDGKGASDETEFTLEVLADSDGDGIPDSDDTDNDNDGYMDNNDAFPDDPDEWRDTDEDGIGNNADSDDDNDGYDDDEDDLPLDDTEWQDTDSDGIGNIADDDDDDDGYDDDEDDFPLDDTEWLDTDSDGIGNNEDPDDDEDGVLDINDKYPLDPTRSKDAEEQESMNMYILLILIIITVFILIMVSIQKNKKVKAGETLAAPLPTQPAIQSGTQNLRCPQCQNLFEAPLASTTIQCPHCGYSAKVQ